MAIATRIRPGIIGALAIAHETASDTEKKGRGSLRLGGGVEYRWKWFALVLELRLVGVGENKELAAIPMETVGYQLARSKLSGGSLAMGANFYFVALTCLLGGVLGPVRQGAAFTRRT